VVGDSALTTLEIAGENRKAHNSGRL